MGRVLPVSTPHGAARRGAAVRPVVRSVVPVKGSGQAAAAGAEWHGGVKGRATCVVGERAICEDAWRGDTIDG